MGFAATAIIGLARNKALAMTVGTSGFGALALLVSLLGSLAAIVGWLSGAGLIRDVAQRRATGEDEEQRVVRSIMSLQLAASLMAAAAFLGATRVFSSALDFDAEAPSWFLWVPAFALPLHTFSGLQSAVLKGHKRLGTLAQISAVGAAVSLLLLIPLVFRWGVNGAAIHVFGEALVMSVTSHLITHRALPSARWSPTLDVDWPAVRRVGGFSAVVQLSAVGVSLAMLLGRARVVHVSGLSAAGLYQAGLALVTYGMIIRNAISTYAFAHFAERRANESTVRDLNATIRISLLLTTPVIGAMLLFAPALVRVLLSPEFLPVTDLALPLLLVVWISSQSALINQTLLAQGYVMRSVMLEICWALVFTTLVFPLTRRFLLAGAVGAYTASYALIWPAAIWTAHRSIGYRTTRTNIVLALTSFALLVAADSAAAWGLAGTLAVGTALMCWFVAGLSLNERQDVWSAARRRLGIAIGTAPRPPGLPR